MHTNLTVKAQVRWESANDCRQAKMMLQSYLNEASDKTTSTDASACYRPNAEKRQTAGIKFTHRPKITFFAPQGRLVAPIHVKFGRADGHVGPLGCTKFHINRHGGGLECSPKISKISTFLVKSPHRDDSLDRFRNFLGAFIRLTILH